MTTKKQTSSKKTSSPEEKDVFTKEDFLKALDRVIQPYPPKLLRQKWNLMSGDTHP